MPKSTNQKKQQGLLASLLFDYYILQFNSCQEDIKEMLNEKSF